ncbi:MAG: UDP-N-acetylmuramoyl-L-alanine--D-glutamate ligase [Bacteroidota bacterium]|nr:UDP-N-acetylmuramoyl-L-alanine--D-glutamate ligase [Bacteroidota bacterium]
MQNIVILGAGESGVGTAVLAKQKGYKVFVSDSQLIKDNYKDILESNHIDFEEGKHSIDKILEADLVMKSPGIPDKVAVVKQIKQRNIPIVSEIEFASRFVSLPTVGITGSNGKTTTTMLTHHLLTQGGLRYGLAGNIGDSFALQVANSDVEGYVLELSSFQLDGIVNYAPHIAVITNLSPDHLDRYDYDYQKYIDAKFRITLNQTPEDYLIYDADDIEIVKWLEKNPIKAQCIGFSVEKQLEKGTYLKDKNTMIVNVDKDELEIPISELVLEGKHNIKNAMSAVTVAKFLKVRNNAIRESLSTFQGIEHRLEKVLKIDNVQYINDSKATNVNAVFYALDSIQTPIVWLVGGVDKGNDYAELMPLVREKIKAIICIGVDNNKIIDAFSKVVDIMVESTDMDQAVKIASKIAEKGDTVLLSPACASFDLFENYQDRGTKFKQAVRKI